jgi:hypothetical protein
VNDFNCNNDISHKPLYFDDMVIFSFTFFINLLIYDLLFIFPQGHYFMLVYSISPYFITMHEVEYLYKYRGFGTMT